MLSIFALAEDRLLDRAAACTSDHSCEAEDAMVVLSWLSVCPSPCLLNGLPDCLLMELLVLCFVCQCECVYSKASKLKLNGLLYIEAPRASVVGQNLR